MSRRAVGDLHPHLLSIIFVINIPNGNPHHHCHQLRGKYDTAALSTMTQSASPGHSSNKSKDTVTGHFQGQLLAAR